MQNADRIQMGDLSQASRIDWRTSSRSIQAPKGKVVVEMLPPVEKIGSLWLSDKAGGNLRSDVGVVVSQPFAEMIQGVKVQTPNPGTLVCTTADTGCWIEGAGFTDNQVRSYGHFCQHEGEPILVDWWLCIPCSIIEGNMKAHGDRIVLRLDTVENKTEGGIYLPDTVKTRGAMATVVSAGPLAFDVSEGDRVCYDPRAVEQTFDLDDDKKDLCILSVKGINYVDIPQAVAV